MSSKAGLPGSHPADMPLRQASTPTTISDDAVPTGDPKDTSELLAERLAAWRHAVEYLENYIEAAEKVEKSHAKECERMLKTISNPLKHGHHFDQGLGGIAGLFENMRQNTQGLINSNLENEKNIKGFVLPILERLRKEIKNKSKELTSGAVKSAKEVEKARNATQKHIELLGQHAASFESTGGKNNAMDDPYVLQQGVHHRLNRQILEENNNRHDLISVQQNFSAFEGHVIEVIQQALAAFNQFVGSHAQKEQTLYGDMLGAAQRVPPTFEWERFMQRNAGMLVDPSTPDRTANAITFPNQEHHSTKALIEGSLERKSRNKLSMHGYTTHYYAVTPSKFLHEYTDNDNLRKDPQPELSIYLPDATIGATNNEKFKVKGKDVSKGLTSKLSGSSELAFKAHTAADAQKWFEVIRAAAGHGPTEPYTSAPGSPASPHDRRQGTEISQISGETPISPVVADTKHPAPLQTSGVTGAETVASPVAVTPHQGQATPATGAPVHAVDHASAPHGTSTGTIGDRI